MRTCVLYFMKLHYFFYVPTHFCTYIYAIINFFYNNQILGRYLYNIEFSIDIYGIHIYIKLFLLLAGYPCGDWYYLSLDLNNIGHLRVVRLSASWEIQNRFIAFSYIHYYVQMRLFVVEDAKHVRASERKT